MSPFAVRFAAALLVIVAAAVGVHNLQRPLANPDEGRYSEISREMALSGDWVTPRLNGVKYFEKPPLQYWATALAFEAFGLNEPAARLYVWLCALATLAITAYTAARIAGAETGVAAAVLVAASRYFLALGGIVTLDMGVTLWTTLTACAFLVSEHAHAAGARGVAGRCMLVA